MHREYFKNYSLVLQQEMEILRFGNYGPPIIWFPTSKGRFYDAENFGAINVLTERINKNQFQVFCVDSIDKQHLYSSKYFYSGKMYNRLLEYYSYISNVCFWIKHTIGAYEDPIFIGPSFGFYHALNMAFRYYPANQAIGLGGAPIFGSYIHDPFHFLKISEEHDLLPNTFERNVKYKLFCGRDDFLLEDNKKMHLLLKELGYNSELTIVPGNHDWQTWNSILSQLNIGN